MSDKLFELFQHIYEYALDAGSQPPAMTLTFDTRRDKSRFLRKLQDDNGRWDYIGKTLLDPSRHVNKFQFRGVDIELNSKETPWLK